MWVRPAPTTRIGSTIALRLRRRDTYTLTATGAGNVAGFEFTVNEANVRTSTAWGADHNCWISRKGDSC